MYIHFGKCHFSYLAKYVILSEDRKTYVRFFKQMAYELDFDLEWASLQSSVSKLKHFCVSS